jgi:monoamine oxidase
MCGPMSLGQIRRRAFLSVSTRTAALAGVGSIPIRVHAAPPARTEVAIVGAGLAGLATAYQLRKLGLRYHLLELTPRIGGRVRTVRYRIGGETVYADSGMEEYWESNPAVALLTELRIPTRADVALSSIVLEGTLHPLANEPRAKFLERVLEPRGVAAWQSLEKKCAPILAEVRGARATPATLALVQPSFAEWVEAQRLPSRLVQWIRVSVECETGTAWDQISALDGIAELHIFMGEGEKSYRVLGGNERFTAALGRAIGPANVSVNHRVTRIERLPGGVRVHFIDVARNVSQALEARHVVSTVPLFRLSEIQFDPPLSEAKRQAIKTQFWGSYFKAHVFLPREAFGAFERDQHSLLPLLSDSELGVMYDGNPDQRTKTRVLSLLISGPHAETFNMMPLDEVRRSLRARMEALFPGLASQIHGIEFHRYHPRAIAAWPPGRSRFDALSEEVRRPEHGVYLAGDFTESSHSEGAFVSATRVVQQIRAARARGSAGAAKPLSAGP